MKCSPLKLTMVVLAYLAAGAVVNVLVAWGIAVWVPFREPQVRSYESPPRFTKRWTPTSWLAAQRDPSDPSQTEWYEIGVSEWSRWGLTFVSLNRWDMPQYVAWRSNPNFESRKLVSDPWFSDFEPAKEPLRVVIVRAGWPLACLEAASDSVLSEWLFGIAPPPAEFRPSVPIPRQWLDVEPLPLIGMANVTRSFIPLSPVWSAMIANTIVWALILAVIVRGPRWVRGEIRMRRGLCRSCGYPIGVSEKCTECGRALPRWMIQMRMPEGAAAPSGISPAEQQTDRGVA